jgi:hypothetical protein
VVLDWNDQLLNSIRADRTNPPRATRFIAMTNVAVYDAVIGIVGGFEPYHVTAAAPPGASPEAAAAAAAHAVLSAAYPGRRATFDAAFATSLAAIPDGPAETAGVDWGHHVAGEILALRSDDGSAVTVPYNSPLGANWWEPTPPAFANPLLPNWPTVTPWCMTSGSQFRQPAPPPLTSGEYTVNFLEVASLGRATGSTRTADQSQIARFWDDGPGSATPPGHWQDIAQTIAQQRGTTLVENARLFALLGLAVADAAIVSWDNKYHWNHWRPVTAIQVAHLDGNAATTADQLWTSFITTPPFPAYTSGHSTFSGSSSKILELFFGTDDVAFDALSDLLPGVTRSFSSLSEAAEEAGQSRIYGGIHWQYDNQNALKSGRALAEHIYFNFLQPVGSPSSCAPSATTLCLNGGRFAVSAAWRTGLGSSGAGQADGLTDDTGTFTFFNPDNVELTVKLLDACTPPFDRFWVFASGLTNVEVVLTVSDTETGRVRRYFNPMGKPFAPVQDTDAFATCP